MGQKNRKPSENTKDSSEQIPLRSLANSEALPSTNNTKLTPKSRFILVFVIIVISILVVASIVVVIIGIHSKKFMKSRTTAGTTTTTSTTTMESITTTISTTTRRSTIYAENITINADQFSYQNTSSNPIPPVHDKRWRQNGTTIVDGNIENNTLDILFDPFSIYIDNDMQAIYITDYYNHRIVE
ncbi:hypothetical protein I4U23_010858 [Adineta vaga]|nr:hypothetical protein I4U23_010858 [Adineta vaga]